MKVVQVSTYDLKGGAARAALRLSCGLREIGCDSYMYVLDRHSDCSHVTAFDPPVQFAARIRRRWRRQRMARDYRQYKNSVRSGMSYSAMDVVSMRKRFWSSAPLEI